MVSFDTVPVLSLKDFISGSPEQRDGFVEDLFEGLKYYGFIVLRDHPIDVERLNKAYDLSKQLFALPEEVKRSYIYKPGAGLRGYTPFGKEHAKDSKFPDLKEFWHVGRDLPEGHRLKSTFPENMWPAELPEFQESYRQLYQDLDDVGRIILKALTGPLEVPSDYFDKMTDAGSSILRLLHYPPIAPGVDPNCIRAAAHEDINLITLLVSASASGLELKSRTGEWMPIVSQPNDIIVDSGDMLARITNDVIPATTHRVVNPSGPNVPRYSMPFFMHPNPDAILSCIDSCRGAGAKYEDISSEQFLMQRLQDIGLTK